VNPRALLTKTSRALLRRIETGWSFTLTVGALFAVAQIIGHLHHEMWRDELHCWAVGRNATGLWDLLTGERKYDGHPFLWYYLLHLVSRLTRSHVALQVVGASLSVMAAVLWLRFANVPRFLRVLLLASYYLLFEYGIMCRSYTLGVVLTFGFCAAYHPCRIRYAALGTLLGLLSATSLYGMLVAIALAAFLFSHGPTVQPPDAGDGRRRLALPMNWGLGLSLFVAGVALTLTTTWPPADALYGPSRVNEVTRATVQTALERYWESVFPFQRMIEWIWPDPGSLGNLIHIPQWIDPWLGGICLVLWSVAFRRALRVVLTYILGVLLIAAGQHFVYVGGLRHLGHFFILTVACIWLHARETRGRRPDRLLHGLFAANLVVQAVTGVAAFRTDFGMRFSAATEVAAFLRAHHLERRPIVADADAPATPVAVILDRPFFFPVTGETTETTVFHNRRIGVDEALLMENARRLARAAGGSALILTSYDLALAPVQGLQAHLLYRGSPGVIPDESLRVYDVRLQ
jgi:hypothetical protein